MYLFKASINGQSNGKLLSGSFIWKRVRQTEHGQATRTTQMYRGCLSSGSRALSKFSILSLLVERSILKITSISTVSIHSSIDSVESKGPWKNYALWRTAYNEEFFYTLWSIAGIGRELLRSIENVIYVLRCRETLYIVSYGPSVGSQENYYYVLWRIAHYQVSLNRNSTVFFPSTETPLKNFQNLA